ncbi:hypothetical protein [Psychrobium sp. 1_MG-2023]|uniref:hypothetical protein n=1 Tax=Psychrobium sp. 1_MG-2023 TaxID=3062624 RepID=UPI002736EF12|nr:hypothetical protein [Psychrobium sp. 1_MG-2023]MDP2562409.1 hypothetical protein [Psychrobium sp. 1_MG-2023]
MKIFRVLTMLLIGCGIVAALTLFGMREYQVSFSTFVNKVAQRLSLISDDQVIIHYDKKYQKTPMHHVSSGDFPRLFLNPLRGWNGLESPLFYQQRVDFLTQANLGFKPNCPNTTLSTALHCYLIKPNTKSQIALETSLINFKFLKPQHSNFYGNAWMFALGVDISMASGKIRHKTKQKLQFRLESMLSEYLTLLDQDSAGLWHGRTNLGAQAFLLATVMDKTTQKQINYYRRALGHFEQVYQAIEATEVWPESYNYWINSRGLEVVLALSAYKNALVEPVAQQKALALIKRIGLWHIYLTRPDFKIEGWGDEGPRVDLKDETARVIDLIAQVTKQPEFFEFSRVIRRHYAHESYFVGYRWMLPLLYSAPEHQTSKQRRKKQPINTTSERLSPMKPLLAPVELFGRGFVNQLIVRSGWADNDTFISYRAGHIFSHHQHYDAGHFTLFKGVPLIVNHAKYNGNVHSPYRFNYAIRTVAKNTLLIQQPNERTVNNKRYSENVADGGQRLVLPSGNAIESFTQWQENLSDGPHYGAATLLDYQYEKDKFTAIGSDITAAYNSTRFSAFGNKAKVKKVTRELVYLDEHDLLLMHDKILTTEPEYKTKWLSHFVNKPSSSSPYNVVQGTDEDGILTTLSRQFIVDNQGSRLTLDVLVPSNTHAHLIGGKTFQHYVETDGNDTELNGQLIEQDFDDKPWFDTGQWRLELSPLNQTGKTHYLVAMQPRILAKEKIAAKVNPIQFHNLSTRPLTHQPLNQVGKVLSMCIDEVDAFSFELSQEVQTLVIFSETAKQLRLSRGHKKNSMSIDVKKGITVLTRPLASKTPWYITKV